MPNRILREGILTSPRIIMLNWPEEVFYRRLISVVDDFGRYHADPMLLRAACYPRQLDKVSDSDIVKWTRCAAEAGLVRVYEVAGQKYLELLDFRQQKRAQKSKFPAPDTHLPSDRAALDTHLQSNAHLGGGGVVVEGESKPLASRDDSRSALNGNAVAYFPLNDGSEFGVSQQHLEEFEKAYPAVDCKQTLQEIRAWCLANPTKRKTKSGALKFVNSWLAREQNKAH